MNKEFKISIVLGIGRLLRNKSVASIHGHLHCMRTKGGGGKTVQRDCVLKAMR